MRIAVVKDGEVINLAEFDSMLLAHVFFAYDGDITLAEAADEIEIGDSFDGDAFARDGKLIEPADKYGELIKLKDDEIAYLRREVEAQGAALEELANIALFATPEEED